MCGRFNSEPDATLAIASTLGVDVDSVQLPIRYNIAPTEQVGVFATIHDQLVYSTMRWWLVPHWSQGPSGKYAMFNARAETIETSRAYSQPFKAKRCIMPATSFIEWHTTSQGKQPYLMNR